ncbi:acyltransferase [Oleiharenicola lentus]|uniref:acyltransferase n=1 Tax=Oleiharenicola lentus TaxID=2508720 RepID=UPI003F666F90
MSRAVNPSPRSSATPAPRSAYIDTIRGVAIFGVVGIHFAGSFSNPGNAWTPSFYLGLYFGQIFNFAVPLFIFLSGVLAGASSRQVSLWEYYRGRLIKIGIPYVAASVASFFLLNHVHEWEALSGFTAHVSWLAQKLLYVGVEPTLYFIPLILQLYFLQPALKALPRWIESLAGGRVSQRSTIVALALLFLVLHVVLGVLCYRSVLSYYVWCRPCSLFWAFYFFCGLHFKVLAALFSRRVLLALAGAGLLVAIGALISDFRYLTDRSAVGANFELNNMDFAYSRPQLLIYDLAMVAVLSVGIALGWAWRPSILSFFGQYTLEIYLWHILLLYECAWRHAEVLETCKQMPEVILLICFLICVMIAGVKHQFGKMVALIRQYRLVLVKESW